VRHRRRRSGALAALALLLAACGGGGDAVIPPFYGTSDVAVADLDGDGRLDIVATVAYFDGPPPHAGWAKVWLQRADAPGSFAPAAGYAVGPDPAVVRVADFDADGVPDLAVMSSHASAVDGAPLVDTLTVLRGDPARPGHFLPGVTLHAGTRLADIAVADFDGDGWADIAFTSYNVGAQVGIWWNRAAAPGSFEAPTALVPTVAGALVASDLDADGRPDLAYVAGGQAWILTRDPAAARAFRPPALVAPGPDLSRLATADLDRDGLPDLVVTSRNDTLFGSGGGVVTLRNDVAAPGRFLPLQALAARVHPNDVVVADMDVNGWFDVVTTGAGVSPNFFDDIVEVYLDRHAAAAGSLAEAVDTVTKDTSSGYHVAAGDLDGDRVPEIVMPYDGGVLLWRQDPARPGALLRGLALP